MRRERREFFAYETGKGSLISSSEAETGLPWMCAGPWCFLSSGDGCSRLTTGTSGTRSAGLRKGQSPGKFFGGLSGLLSRRCRGLRPCVESGPEPEDSSPVLTWILGCSRLTTGTSGTRSAGLRKGQSPGKFFGGLSGLLSRRCRGLRPCVESGPEPEDSSPVLTWILGCSRLKTGTSGTRSAGLRKGQSPGKFFGGLSGLLSRRCRGLRPCVESGPEPEDSSPVLTWILGCSRLTTGTSGTRSAGLRKGQSPGEFLGGLSGLLSRRCRGLRPCVESGPEPEDSSPVLTWILGRQKRGSPGCVRDPGASSRVETGLSHVHTWWESILGLNVKAVQENRFLWNGLKHLRDSWNGGTTLEFLSPFLWRAPPLEMRRERREFFAYETGKGSLISS
ncbi:hypothetical protein MJG53_006151 [Ovis ammon polii x Ovis aries]|uniref:Uncharacterized protein n=1 Tax=Ovis ammon polii x Ovis aries TaxID=2918886 RepID=A0ACB9V7P8_9CETA|nr:hypothetical protein MJG53_006151 [Ovis ammon polii x Ovis aries]